MMQPQVFQQIAMELRKRIREGIYTPGEMLPSRNGLMKDFGVARATVDRAIRMLVRSGDLQCRRGAGTIVTSKCLRKYQVAQIGGEPPVRTPAEFEIIFLKEDAVKPRSEWHSLFQFDGLIFVRPEKDLLPLIMEVAPQHPAYTINRQFAGIPFVSTDFQKAYRDIVCERLSLHPNGRAVYLRSGVDTLATQYRLNGFIAGCHACGKLYEILDLPLGFEDKLSLFRKRLALRHNSPLFLFSDILGNTGAVMYWARSEGAVWRKNLFYCDFDNIYAENVWGVKVTTFRQNNEELYHCAYQSLLECLQGNPARSLLIPPLRREQDT